MLELISSVSTREGVEVAMPKKISTLLAAINKWLHHKKKKIYTVYIPPPRTLFGKDSTVPPIKYVCYDIMEVIAHMLVDTNIVGKTNEFFKFEAEEKYMAQGEEMVRVYSDSNTAEFFIRSQRHIRALHGNHVHLLPFILSYDKTTLSRNGIRTATPMYVSIANQTSKQLQLDGSTDLVGYLPDLPLSVTEIRRALDDSGVKAKTNRNKAVSMYKRHIEQTVSLQLYVFVYT